MIARTVLMVVHDYPPINSAGTERIIKFAHYLPDFGYQPIVLTTGRYGGLPTDVTNRVHRADDLVHIAFGFMRRHRASDRPQESQFRVATVANRSMLGRLRDAIMIPDTKLGWLLPAERLGRRLIAEYRPELIFSSSPPETTHLIAGHLSRAADVPWVADLRDGWLFEPPNPALRRPLVRRWLEGRMERGMIQQASALVAVTAPIANDLRSRYGLEAHSVQVVTNGYDRAEFAGLSRQRRPDGAFLVVYTGSLSSSRRGTSADAFFKAVTLLLEKDPATPLRVRIVGDVSTDERASAAVLGLSPIVSFVPPVDRREAHQHQLDADALLLITAPGQRSVATLKLFDYIGAGVPILALAQNNAAAEIIQDYDLGVIVPPDDPAAIGHGISELMRRQREWAMWPGFAAAQTRFERRALTGELARLFDVVSNRPTQ